MQREDCRPLFLKKNNVWLQYTDYVESEGAFLARTQLQPLQMRVLTTGSMRYFRVAADYGDAQRSIVLRNLQSAEEPSVQPLAGKNQMVFESGKQLFVLNRFQPLEVWRVLGRTKVKAVEVEEQPELKGMDVFNLNGGKMVLLHESGERLGLIHRHYGMNNTSGVWGTHYTHAFFTMSMKPPYRILRVSHEWCIGSLVRPGDCEAIQFVTSIERDGGVLILGYGANDLEAMVMTLRVDDVLGMLRPVKSGRRVHRRGGARQLRVIRGGIGAK
jgi:hypothetical protein